MLSAYNDNFTSSLPICVLLFIFSLLAVAKTSNTILNGVGILVLFQSLPLSIQLAVGLS